MVSEAMVDYLWVRIKFILYMRTYLEANKLLK